jgi:hypothetical protein
MVRRLMEGINAGNMDIVDELFAPRAARRVKQLFAEFYSAFPDRTGLSELSMSKTTRRWVAGHKRPETNGSPRMHQRVSRRMASQRDHTKVTPSLTLLSG